MAGERWYRIELEDRHVGYMYHRSYQQREGHWVFESTTHFLLQDNSPNTISKQLVFGAEVPNDLIRARYTNARGDSTDIALDLTQASAYEARVQRGQDTTTLPVDWSFTMADFLAFESWLLRSGPQTGETFNVQDPDFEKLRIARRNYEVIGQNEIGYIVQTQALLAPTVTQLDTRYQPISLSMAGVFEIDRTSEVHAVAIQEMQSKTSYVFEVDQRLSDHTRLDSLSLRTHNAANTLPATLSLSRGEAAAHADPELFIGEELDYPVSHRRIQSMVQSALGTSDPRLLAERLLNAAHKALQYAEDNPAGGVLKALDRGFGECTDFADLLTTLARASQIPARTVFGLAYRDGSRPGFMYHAWNELYLNDRWVPMDPTWNQAQIDATHIPLSDQQSAAIMLAHSRTPIRFEVLGASYGD